MGFIEGFLDSEEQRQPVLLFKTFYFLCCHIKAPKLKRHVLHLNQTKWGKCSWFWINALITLGAETILWAKSIALVVKIFINTMFPEWVKFSFFLYQPVHYIIEPLQNLFLFHVHSQEIIWNVATSYGEKLPLLCHIYSTSCFLYCKVCRGVFLNFL